LKRLAKQFIYAVSFLTVFPVKIGEASERDLAGSAVFFPVVGYLIGAILLGAHYCAGFLAGNPAAAVFTVAVWLCVTRMLHFDGLTDVADGFWGGKSPEDRMRIMKDSRMGSFGTAAGILLIAGKIVFLTQLPSKTVLMTLLVIPAAARMTTPIICAATRKAAGEGLGAIFVRNTSRPAMIVAAVLFLVLSFFILDPLRAAIVAAVAAVVSLSAVRMARRMIGGVNGDVLGAAIEITEWLCLLALCVAEKQNI
jgi:adenosylcobinamide-GDP ribazoletransferase